MTYTLSRDYIPLTRITYQAFGLNKNKTVRRLSYFFEKVAQIRSPLHFWAMCSNHYIFLMKYFSCEKYEIILTDYEI